VDVKIKRHGGPAEFFHPLHRIQSSGHPNFEDVFTEGTDIRKHIDMSLLRELGHGFGALILLMRILYFLLQRRQSLSFQFFPVNTFSGEQGLLQ